MRFNLDSGGTVVVEVDDDEPGVSRASRTTQAIREAGASFSSALSGVRDAAASALHTFQQMQHRPDEVTVEFGIRLNAEAGAVIAKTEAEGHLQVTLTWKHHETQTSAG
ncbi:CU044_2847 family protein [Streptomyces sp. NPDC058424]|uniref:CU044_2847 family protein n=1 Tax=Streptomyces sp. NPDC058424 TaxID=3346491 RepID=UPI00364FA0A1